MPTVKLTKRLIESWPVGAKAIELRDSETTGFLCKITPAGRRTFMIAYRAADGTKRQPKIGTLGALTLDEARTVAKRMLGAVARGEDPSAARRSARAAPTVAELCDRFLNERIVPRRAPTYVKAVRRLIDKRIKPALGPRKVAAVDGDDIARLHHRLRATPYEGNRTLAALKTMFSAAELWKMRPANSNPCRGVVPYPEGRRERLFTDGEVAALYTALDALEREAEEHASDALHHPSIRLAIRLLFATAGRVSEILRLRWADVREDEGELVWPSSKAGHEIRRPITSEIRALLDGARRVVGNPYVVVGIADPRGPLSPHTLDHVWRRILDRAGVPRCGLHQIRHYVATRIANAGVDLRTGMSLTGHRSVVMFARYLHAERDRARAAAERVAQARASAIETHKGKIVPLGRSR